MILNVEQYEYMRGPQNDAGIKVRHNFFNNISACNIVWIFLGIVIHKFKCVDTKQHYTIPS